MSDANQTPAPSSASEPDRDNPGDENPQTAPAAEGDTSPTEQRPEDGSAATGTTDGSDTARG